MNTVSFGLIASLSMIAGGAGVALVGLVFSVSLYMLSSPLLERFERALFRVVAIGLMVAGVGVAILIVTFGFVTLHYIATGGSVPR